MAAWDVNTGAGSDRACGGPTGDSSSTPSSSTTSSTIGPPLLRPPAARTPVPPEISELGGATSQLRLADSVIGFIRQVGRVFVVLDGDRLDLSVECGQFQSWDLAVQELVTRSGLAETQDALAARRARLIAQPGMAENAPPQAASTTKAGELLAFRPRSRPRPSKTLMSPVAAERRTVVILHRGREFHTTLERAEQFYAWARSVADSGEAALVPLGHNDGVDLLLITGNTPLE